MRFPSRTVQHTKNRSLSKNTGLLPDVIEGQETGELHIAICNVPGIINRRYERLGFPAAGAGYLGLPAADVSLP
jgi:hypothetical protein